MKKAILHRSAAVIMALLLLLTVCGFAHAESYAANTMRLANFEGDVQIEDASGQPRFVMKNARFDSGEALITGEASAATVSLDDSKFVSLDENTRVAFAKSGGALTLNLTDGALMLDVSKKLSGGESLDIQTSTMTVGIRGTIVFVRDEPAADGGRMSTLGVLEGTAQLRYVDASNETRAMAVPAGQVAVVKADADGQVREAPDLAQTDAASIPGFVAEQVNNDDALRHRVEEAMNQDYAADGDWTWNGTVTLVAQSASKLYDGAPLTRPGDVLVYGLPSGFSITVRASGSQTDAGVSANNVSSYSIRNARGEDVTSHFTHVEKVSGQLVVDPAPLTVWTGSAEKVYDGTPLTCPETGLSSVPGYERNTTPWRNMSYVSGGASGVQTLYALSGSIWVHGTNPLTGETREIQLSAGQKMEVLLNDDGTAASIELKVETAKVEEIPDDVLRLYADNPELLAQACADAGWDVEALQARVDQLRESDNARVQKDGLTVETDAADRLMRDSTNVRITVDSDITSYNNRALGSDEARYTPVHIDAGITVTATGSQTEVGESPNTCEIDWGGTNPGNYILSEELGTLTVLEPEAPPIEDAVTLTAASAEKVYDGSPLTDASVKAEGLPEGYSAEAEAEGSITDAGAAANKVTSYKILDADGNDATAQFTNVTLKSGTLTVAPLKLSVDLGGADATYDGKPFIPAVTVTYLNGPHAGETAGTRAGSKRYAAGPEEASTETPAEVAQVQSYALFTGDAVSLTVSGGGSGAGKHTITASLSVTEGKSINFDPVYTHIEYTIAPAPLTVTTGSAEKPYDGKPLTSAEATLEGLVEGETAAIAATGTLTDVGTADNTYAIEWGDTDPANYAITEALGTLKVTANDAEIIFTADSASKTYDGKPLTKNTYTVTGVPEGLTATATVAGSITDAGTADNTVSAYKIMSGEQDVTASFSNITTAKGALTVEKAAATVTTLSASKIYDGAPLTKAGATLTGLAEGDTATATATGAITDAGSTENTYTIDWGETKASNYTLTESLGTLEVTPFKLTIDLGGHTAEYDGDPQMPQGPKCESVPSEGIHVVTDGTERDVGTSNVFTLPGGQLAVTVMGFEDAGTHTLIPELEFLSGRVANYNITYTSQTMTITPMKVTVTLHDGSPLTYNGQAQLGKFSATGLGFDIGWTLDGQRGFTWGSDRAIVTVTGGGSDAGSYTLSGSVSMESGKASNYDVSFTGTSMVIDPAPLTVTASSEVKEYDGTPLTGTASVAGLAAGDTVTATAAGSITDVGTTDNTCSVDWGDTKASNYTVTQVDGTLEVTKNYTPIGLGVDNDAYKTYNGSIQTGDLLVVDLPAGLTVKADITGGGKDVGTYPCSVGDYKIYKGEQDVTANFEAVYKENGSVTITRVSGSLGVTGSYEYDGKVHYGKLTADCDGNPTVSKVSDTVWTVSWSWGDSFTITLGNGRAEVGSHTISLSREFGAGTDPDNYMVIAPDMDRVIKITPATLTITTKSAKKGYDGTMLTHFDYSVDGLAPGEDLVVVVTGQQTEVGKSDNTYTINWGASSAEEDNYTVVSNLGTLEVVQDPSVMPTYDNPGPLPVIVEDSDPDAEPSESVEPETTPAPEEPTLADLDEDAPEPDDATSAPAEPEQSDAPETEPSEPAAEKPEEPRTEEPKAEAPKTEEPKAEEPKAEAPKTEEPKTEEPKAEESKTEAPKSEEPKSEEKKAEEPKAEAPKAEPPKAEESKTEAPKTEAPKAEEKKAEAPKAEAPKAEEKKAEAPKTEAPNAEEKKAEAPKAEAPKAEEKKAEAPKAEAPKAEEKKAEAPKAEAPKAEEKKAEAPKTEAPKAEEKKTEEPKAEEPSEDA